MCISLLIKVFRFSLLLLSWIFFHTFYYFFLLDTNFDPYYHARLKCSGMIPYRALLSFHILLDESPNLVLNYFHFRRINRSFLSDRFSFNNDCQSLKDWLVLKQKKKKKSEMWCLNKGSKKLKKTHLFLLLSTLFVMKYNSNVVGLTENFYFLWEKMAWHL